jgi:serine-type D-Ala-D-Ala carboxypeptidase/endopeptidase (penicillin-binding protein 4)
MPVLFPSRLRPVCRTLVISTVLIASAHGAAKQSLAHARVPLAKTVTRLLSQPSMASAHWGISVVSLSGRTIYALNDAQHFNPASNAKLFTTSAAFALLPGNLTYTTSVVSNAGIDATGKLQGDLVILGAGDPNISGRTLPYDGKTERPSPPLAALEAMADQIVSRGVHSIAGNIVGDDTWFPYERYPSGWGWDDLEWGYGSPISALTVNDNVVYLQTTPASQAGQTASASWLPATSYYTLENSLTTVTGPAEKPGIDRLPGSLVVRLYGQVLLGGEGVHAALAIEDPADYAARSLREMLEARGIQIKGTASARHRFPADTADFLTEQHEPLELHPISIATVEAEISGATVLASHVSPPLIEDLVVMNKVSQNLHAELLLRTLGKLEGLDGSLVEGTRVVRQFLIEAGVAPDDFVFYDGSGLSPKDLVSPRAFTTLLVYAAKQSWGDAFRSTLPIGGEDGTLAGRFKERTLNGKVFAKTGTLAEATALSGYVNAASGQTVAFSILCNDHSPGNEVRQTMDQIVAAIARTN